MEEILPTINGEQNEKRDILIASIDNKTNTISISFDENFLSYDILISIIRYSFLNILPKLLLK